jgi:hypothetical protein
MCKSAQCQWKPIETAPRDGTLILLADISPDDHCVKCAEQGCWEFIEVSDYDGAVIYDWSTAMGRIEFPTHWMPLPSFQQ